MQCLCTESDSVLLTCYMPNAMTGRIVGMERAEIWMKLCLCLAEGEQHFSLIDLYWPVLQPQSSLPLKHKASLLFFYLILIVHTVPTYILVLPLMPH